MTISTVTVVGANVTMGKNMSAILLQRNILIRDIWGSF